jgi:hypothetical protein
LTFAGSAPVSRSQASTTDENASLTSNASMSARVSPARASTLAVAGMIPVSIRIGSSPTAVAVCTRARGRQPRRRAISPVVTTRAAAPSLTGLELPAVTFHSRAPNRCAQRSSAKAGRSPARVSTVVPGRIVSSVSRPASGATWPANRPCFHASAARWWLVAANSSSSARLRPHRRAISSALIPCGISPPG